MLPPSLAFVTVYIITLNPVLSMVSEQLTLLFSGQDVKRTTTEHAQKPTGNPHSDVVILLQSR